MIKKIIFALIPLIFFLSLLETAARIIYPFWYKKFQKDIQLEESSFYRHDPVLGWRMIPNYEETRHINNVPTHYKTNSLGFRDREFTFEKPKGTYRLICLGDSITEGMAVDNEKAYPKLLEAILNKDRGEKTRYEVINAGVVDYGTDQEYIFLKEIGLKFNPDMVMLGFFLNDGRQFVPSKAIYFNSKNLDNFISKSKFLYLLDRMIMKYKIKYQYKKWEKNRHEFWMPLYKTDTWRTNKDDRYKLIKLSERDWGLAWTDKGWQRCKMFFDKFLELSAKDNFKFVIVAFPIDIQLYADKNDSYMFLPQEKLKVYCQEHKIPFVDMLPIFKKYSAKEVLFDYCHPTPLGLELTTKAIYETIKNEISR